MQPRRPRVDPTGYEPDGDVERWLETMVGTLGPTLGGVNLRRHLPCAVMTLGAVTAVWGSFRPWLASGSAERSSYELLGLVDRLGTSSTVLTWAVAAWPLMPLLVVTATVVVWWGRHAVGGVIGAIGGIYATLVSFGIRRAPDDGLIRSLPGASITLLGSAVFLGGLLASVVAARADVRTGATVPALRAPAGARPAHRS